MILQGKNVIVTGAARGLGKQFAMTLKEKGCKINILDIDTATLKQLNSDYPEFSTYHCDVADFQQVEKTLNQIFTNTGPIHILINNAGIIHNEPLLSFSPTGLNKHSLKNWQKVMAVNLDSVFNLTVNTAEKMLLKRTKGIIINISSVSSRGNAGQTAYSASKAAINALTATWAKELGPMGIRVAGISPGFIDTESTHLHLSPEKEKELIRKIPLRKFGRSENIVETLLFILENDYFTGRTIEIDGGIEL